MLPNHVPNPGHKSGHLGVHIWSLGVAAPEAGEGNEAVGPVPAHQGPPGVRLEGRERRGQAFFSASVCLKGLLHVKPTRTLSRPSNPSMTP